MSGNQVGIKIISVNGEERMTEVDKSRPSAARVYDYMLGGKDNFAVDRELADGLLAMAPTSSRIARNNRAFLGRAVRYCADEGIRQFLDLGSGLPTRDNVHEVAQRVDPACRVVYVDNDPVAVAHGQALLADGTKVSAIHGDFRQPAQILSHPEVRKLIDFAEPVVVLMVASLHFVRDAEDPAAVIARYTDVMAPGSYLVLSHACHDVKPEESSLARSMYQRASAQLVTRSKQQIGEFFTGLELVDPGLALTGRWRAQITGAGEDDDLYAGVARKP